MGRVKIKMPKDVAFILDKLNTKDSTAYIVGGCVRDSLMHNTPHDWDICTSLKPEQIKEIFNKLFGSRKTMNLKMPSVDVFDLSEIASSPMPFHMEPAETCTLMIRTVKGWNAQSGDSQLPRA